MMGNTVIEVNNISKRYRIGLKEEVDTFAEQVKNTLLYPIRNFKKITSLNTFKGEDDQSIFWALQNINFKVEQGEVLGIIGKNGAGKSTLLKILSKITEPTTGNIKLKGRVSALLEVGTGFHPELTGRDNIYMNGTILGMTRKEINQKLDEIIAFSGIEKHIDTPVKFYSSGMKVRLGFSVAAHLEPEILIIDEVLAVGDFEFQKKCLGKMDDVAKSGRTVLFVSHDMAAVSNLCSRVLLLKNGKILGNGNTDTIINKYLYKSKEPKSNEKRLLVENEEFKFNVFDIGIYPRSNPNSIIKTGDNVILKFNYEFNGLEKINSFDISVHIKDSSDRIITTFSPKYFSLNFNDISKRGIVTCDVNNFPLMAGTYKLDFWLSVNGYEESFEQIVTFQIDRGDFYGFGYLPKQKRKSLLAINQGWKIQTIL